MSIPNINKKFGIYHKKNREMLIPLAIKKYVILKFIAETNSSVIVSAKVRKSKVKYAIKCIPISFFNRHEDEWKIMTDSNHPNIIKCIDYFKFPSDYPRFFVIVMPLAYRDLVRYITDKRGVYEPFACIIMREILSAVQYLHINNIIHQDLKCDNIFIMEETENGPRAVLGDFGLSIRCNGSYVDCFPVGTTIYSAPELLVENDKDLYGISFKDQKVKCLFS